MKKFSILSAIIFLLLTKISGQINISSIDKNETINIHQDVNIISAGTAHLYDGSLETTETLVFKSPTLDLSNIIFKAKKIIIDAAVLNIEINGEVKFECDEIEFAGAGTNLQIKAIGVGEFTISYKKRLTLIGRKIEQAPINGQNFGVRFEKVKK